MQKRKVSKRNGAIASKYRKDELLYCFSSITDINAIQQF